MVSRRLVALCPIWGGTLLLIADHSASALGQMGQVIAYTHDPDMMDFISPDLSQFFARSITQQPFVS